MTKPSVTIIDYGIGNLRSIEKAFEAVGVSVTRTDQPVVIAQAERVVLPGVGAFGACATELRRRGLEPVIHKVIAEGVPFLGVCVGMQLLFDLGEEMGDYEGLGVLPGRVVRFEGHPTRGGLESDAVPLKVPHMGWNTITPHRPSPLLYGLDDTSHFYYVHSYHVVPDDLDDVVAITAYGVHFPAIVGRNNVFGVQFHPEKSQQNGLRILKNFVHRTG